MPYKHNPFLAAFDQTAQNGNTDNELEMIEMPSNQQEMVHIEKSYHELLTYLGIPPRLPRYGRHYHRAIRDYIGIKPHYTIQEIMAIISAFERNSRYNQFKVEINFSYGDFPQIGKKKLYGKIFSSILMKSAFLILSLLASYQFMNFLEEDYQYMLPTWRKWLTFISLSILFSWGNIEVADHLINFVFHFEKKINKISVKLDFSHLSRDC